MVEGAEEVAVAVVNGQTIEMGTVVVVGVLFVENRRFKMNGSRDRGIAGACNFSISNSYRIIR